MSAPTTHHYEIPRGFSLEKNRGNALRMIKGGTAKIPPTFDSVDPLYRRWRSAVLWTIHDLRRSAVTRRPLSLPNSCRLFEYRWYKACPGQRLAWGLEAGRAVLGRLYEGRQPCDRPMRLTNSRW